MRLPDSNVSHESIDLFTRLIDQIASNTTEPPKSSTKHSSGWSSILPKFKVGDWVIYAAVNQKSYNDTLGKIVKTLNRDDGFFYDIKNTNQSIDSGISEKWIKRKANQEEIDAAGSTKAKTKSEEPEFDIGDWVVHHPTVNHYVGKIRAVSMNKVNGYYIYRIIEADGTEHPSVSELFLRKATQTEIDAATKKTKSNPRFKVGDWVAYRQFDPRRTIIGQVISVTEQPPIYYTLVPI